MRPSPPFRAEHVGSLLRPAELRSAFRRFSEGAIDEDEFHSAQDQAIADVVRRQQDIGLSVVTDGEFRRASYWSHFVDQVEGLDVAQARFDFHDESGHSTHFLAPRVTSKLASPGSISGLEYEYLASVTEATPKTTIPSPPTMHFWGDPAAPETAGYDGLAEFFVDIADVYQAELADLAARGATYVQIDEVPLAMLCDEDLRGRLEAEGEDPDTHVTNYIDLINSSLAGRSEDLTVGMHLCRGNFKGQWLSEGGYDYVARRLFAEVDVDAFFLEYDSERAGGFEPLQTVPDEKMIVLGLISTKTPVLEDRDLLKARIDAAARYVPLDRLALSPQCGFASTVAGNPVTEAHQFAKLEMIVNVASDVWAD